MIIWILKILRLFFSLFDKITFWAVEMIYALFMNIASAGIFSQATIQVFASRIYIFLGLIMVFKVSISLVTYIMNPDNFSKGDVGAPALLKGFIFALVGIVLVPYVFEIAYSAQRIILKENVIGNLILGMGAKENEKFTGDYLKEGGKNMASTIMSTFYKPDIEALGLSEECAVNPITSCKKDLEEKFEDKVWDKFQTAFGTEPRDVDDMLDGDILNATWQNKKGDTVFIMDYTFIISTLCGLLVAYILFLFCVDIAVRSVKLSFLQLIAPIPLISKVDPKKGDKVFGNWMKECVSTYLDVFIRLLAIYFALFIISAISNKPVNMVTGEDYTGFTGLLLSVFLIIGALNFARELPKLIGGIFGIDFKGMGGFTLNPAKKFGATPLIGGALVGAAGLAGRSAGQLAALGGNLIGGTPAATWVSGKANDIAEKIKKNSMVKKIGGGIGSIKEGIGNFDKNHGGHLSSIGYDAANTAHGIGAAALQSAGVLDRRLDRLEMEKARLMQNEQKRKDDIASAQAYKDSYSKMEDRAWEQITSGKAGRMSEDYMRKFASLEAAKNSGDADAIAAAQTAFDSFKKENLSKYMTDSDYKEFREKDETYMELQNENEIAFENYYANSDDENPGYSVNSAEALSNTCKGAIHKHTMANAETVSKEKARMAQIDVEQQKIKEDIKSSKPYMPFPGGKK